MKNDPYQLILNGSPIGEIVRAIMALNEKELAQRAANLNGGQLVSLLDMSATAYRKREVQSMLITGAVLLSISIATAGPKKEMFDLLLADMEISESQGYRCINSFRHFGNRLLKNEKLQSAFTVEGIKILSGPKVPEEARVESLKLAERGERITIKKAKALIAPSKAASTPTKKPRPTRKRPSLISKFKSLVEKVATEFQKPQPAVPSEDVDILIDRLEGLLGQLKARRPPVTNSTNPTKREHANV